VYAYQTATNGRGYRTKIIMGTGGKRSAGFTIVETMIVLGVSAALLTVGLLYVNGRQNKTQFMVAINGEKQVIEQTINETANGFYPKLNGKDFTCLGSAGAQPTFNLAGTSLQGTNSGCTFLGKVLTIGVDGDGSKTVIYPLVGNQKTTGASARDVQSFAEALPVVMGPTNSATPAWQDLGVTTSLDNGLKLLNTKYTFLNGTTYTPLVAVLVIADNLSQYAPNSSNGLNSSAQKLDLFTYPSASVLSLGLSAYPSSKTLVDTSNAAGNYPPSGASGVSKVDLCFVSGSTNQSGIITVSGLGQLSVTLSIKNNKTCS
jgi:type II secretory pathway pseudopilin PulG